MTEPLASIRRSIEQHVVFAGPQFARFASALRRRSLEPGEMLLAPGEICGFEAYVVSGCLRVYHIGRDAAEHILDFASEGAWVADTDSYVRQIPASLGVTALQSSEVLLLDRGAKEALCAEIPALERLFRILAQRAVVSLQRRTLALMYETAERRYADFKARYPDLERRLARYQVASYLGISPEFLSRISRRSGAPGARRSRS
jgi:CRP-like cAMP-binding protein